MACVEYECTKCDWSDMTNDMIRVCPMCASPVTAFFDEPGTCSESDDEEDTELNNVHNEDIAL